MGDETSIVPSRFQRFWGFWLRFIPGIVGFPLKRGEKASPSSLLRVLHPRPLPVFLWELPEIILENLSNPRTLGWFGLENQKSHPVPLPGLGDFQGWGGRECDPKETPNLGGGEGFWGGFLGLTWPCRARSTSATSQTPAPRIPSGPRSLPELENCERNP